MMCAARPRLDGMRTERHDDIPVRRAAHGRHSGRGLGAAEPADSLGGTHLETGQAASARRSPVAHATSRHRQLSWMNEHRCRVVCHSQTMDTERNTPVVFAFHGYQRAIHEIIHGRPNAERFHVRGFNEQGTTTTPFDMVVLNGMSHYDLAAEALRRSSRMAERAPELIAACNGLISAAVAYSKEHLEDMPEIRDWIWTER